jgi:hypothetical protein
MMETGVATVASSTSRLSHIAKERLPKHVLKQVLQDIEANEGIQAYVDTGQRLYHLVEARVSKSATATLIHYNQP